MMSMSSFLEDFVLSFYTLIEPCLDIPSIVSLAQTNKSYYASLLSPATDEGEGGSRTLKVTQFIYKLDAGPTPNPCALIKLIKGPFYRLPLPDIKRLRLSIPPLECICSTDDDEYAGSFASVLTSMTNLEVIDLHFIVGYDVRHLNYYLSFIRDRNRSRNTGQPTLSKARLWCNILQNQNDDRIFPCVQNILPFIDYAATGTLLSFELSVPRECWDSRSIAALVRLLRNQHRLQKLSINFNEYEDTDGACINCLLEFIKSREGQPSIFIHISGLDFDYDTLDPNFDIDEDFGRFYTSTGAHCLLSDTWTGSGWEFVVEGEIFSDWTRKVNCS